ncbi:MAG TPA: hypothetical protein VFS31_12310 [Chitinophagaceae bacterium]|nr:hypothetical protein [Chitinophagaceae bacterium]
MEEKELIISINQSMNLALPVHLKTAEIRQALREKINRMILEDFSGLVQALYHMDVSESKLRTLLESQPQTDAADMIATLIIERQIEKWKSRQKFRQAPPPAGSEEETW